MSGAAAPTQQHLPFQEPERATQYEDNPLSLLWTPKGILNRNDTPRSHRTSDMWHLLLPIWSQLGSSHSWVFAPSFPFSDPLHKIGENLPGTNQSEHIRASAVYTHPQSHSQLLQGERTISVLRETPRPGAPGTAHPSSSRNQDNAERSHLQWGSCPC